MNDRIIGHYRILEKIGAGAMGEVFRARDERLGRDVALKVIHAGSSGNPDHVRRFEVEARAAAALNHPNIVAIYDVGLDGGSPYIVCELLEGQTLRQRLLDGPLPVRLTVDYALQIIQGLVAAHERRIVHRDLKPENLFVTRDGRVKILDFGVAKLQSGNEEGRTVEDLTTITKTGAVIGTVAYMSPEQLRGKSVDHRSDIFSIGGILYEMLTGRRPFRGETEVDTITAILREDPPELELEHANIPLSFRQVVGHCLEKEPEKRFQSARDLEFALETLPSAPTGRARFGPPKLKNKLLPWAVTATLLIVTLLLAGNPRQVTILAPPYRRITFDQGTLYAARYSPDFRSVVFSASWNGRPLQVFSTVANSVSAQAMDIPEGNLLGISKTGELALLLNGSRQTHLQIEKGMMARAPLAGGSPREVLEDVRSADWSANGDLAVIHHAEDRDRIEYPIGHVLYVGQGWISHIRFSPDSQKLAFIEHDGPWDDRGVVCLMDLFGHVKVLTRDWESVIGLSWHPDGKEIWFTAAQNGYTRGLLAVDTSGKHVRTILAIPAGLTLHDIAPDGRVLMSMDSERLAMATSTREGKAVNLSWHDWDVAKGISRDGQSLLFEDSSEAAPPHFSVAIRRLDGTPPIFLGEGSAGGLSPDGKWAISMLTAPKSSVNLLPIGPGQPRAVPIGNLEIHSEISHFLADGKRFTITANEPGHELRSYLLNVDGGKPIPITPEGVNGGIVSPDGQFILAKNGANLAVYSTSGGSPRAIPGLESNFRALQWSEDNSAVYGYVPGQSIPAKIFKLDLATGRKTFIKDLEPESNTGVVIVSPVVVSRDASRFAFSYYQVLSVLYEISGLK